MLSHSTKLDVRRAVPEFAKERSTADIVFCLPVDFAFSRSSFMAWTKLACFDSRVALLQANKQSLCSIISALPSAPVARAIDLFFLFLRWTPDRATPPQP